MIYLSFGSIGDVQDLWMVYFSPTTLSSSRNFVICTSCSHEFSQFSTHAHTHRLTHFSRLCVRRDRDGSRQYTHVCLCWRVLNLGRLGGELLCRHTTAARQRRTDGCTHTHAHTHALAEPNTNTHTRDARTDRCDKRRRRFGSRRRREHDGNSTGTQH